MELMMEKIQEGFDVLLHDGEVAFADVLRVLPRGDLVIYVENAGEFTVPAAAIKDVHDEKVILNCDRLDAKLKNAIGHAHDAEDPNVADEE